MTLVHTNVAEIATEQPASLELADGLRRSRFTLFGVRLLSGLINFLMLTGLLFMLPFHDRVLPSETALALLGLLVLTATLVLFPTTVDAIRRRARPRAGSSNNDDLPAKQAAGSELASALRRCRLAFLGIGLFSGLINILMLTGPLFMLQIYDRILPSHSVPTLIGLAILTVGLFSFQGVLDAIRGRVLLRIGGSISDDLSARAYDAVVRLPIPRQPAVRPIIPRFS